MLVFKRELCEKELKKARNKGCYSCGATWCEEMEGKEVVFGNKDEKIGICEECCLIHRSWCEEV